MSVDAAMDTSKLPSQVIVTTGIGNMVTPAMMCKRPVTIPQYTTLNEVYNVLANDSIGAKKGEDFTLAYFGIGIKGATCIGGDSNGISRMQVNQHQPIDFNMFFGIPFLVRLQNADLEASERDKYRIRVPFTKNGTKYIAYYLKKIGFAQFDPKMNLVTRDESTGSEDTKPYIPVPEDLHPEPVPMDSMGSVPLTNQYIDSSAKLDTSLLEVDLSELKNACRILYNDANYANLNEYCLVAGIETTNTGPVGDAASVTYKELSSSVITHHITEAYARSANANGKITLLFDIGSAAPLLVYSSRIDSASAVGM